MHNENPTGRYHTIAFMCADANMSRNTLVRLAAEAGALIQVGSRGKRIDSEKFYDYLGSVYSIEER